MIIQIRAKNYVFLKVFKNFTTRRLVRLIMVVLLAASVQIMSPLPVSGTGESPQPTSRTIADLLRIRLETGQPFERIRLGPEIVLAKNALPDFYDQRFFAPAWIERQRPKKSAYKFLEVLRRVDEEGLNPNNYHIETIERHLKEIEKGHPNTELLVDFDILLSDAFLMLVAHFNKGSINPETIDPEWHARRPGYDPVPVLIKALKTDSFYETLRQQLPSAPEYSGLRAALERYRRIQADGGWPTLASDITLYPGTRGSVFPILRRRLEISGDGQNLSGVADPEAYDALLVEAVRGFQVRHGLNPDGVIGPATLAALNITATERVRQIETNLERWRWLPQELGEKYILVNIAAFELYLLESGNDALRMKVVVGKPYRRTPVFSDRMTYLVLNPYWNVPRKIATEDLLPKFRKDPGLSKKLGIKVFHGWGADAQEIDPTKIDWTQISKNNFPFHLRQDPGPENALGQVKFMFPNKFEVYLHDTPARDLFQKESRIFSSGCIRLEKPLELAQYLMEGERRGGRKALEQLLQKEKSFSVRLPKTVPVHLLYWTAWVDRENMLHFRPDVYDRDKSLGEALAKKPPLY